MALRGDSIDNIPGAPGIGDKGSVEIIKRFGTVEAALDRAAEVEKRTYRESLQNNRDVILLSKELVTLDRNVPVEFDLERMIAGEPDTGALRDLFTELEFTTLLKELTVDIGATDYTEAKSPADISAALKQLKKGSARAPPHSHQRAKKEEGRGGGGRGSAATSRRARGRPRRAARHRPLPRSGEGRYRRARLRRRPKARRSPRG
jgi:DNA polymerase-1